LLPMTAALHTPTAPTTLTITRPDDWHLHVRDGEPLHTVVPHTAAQFGRAIIMPNLRPPGTTAEQAMAYKTLEAMQKAGMLLLVHGEVTSSDIDLFDREAVFIEQQLIPLRRDFPELKIVFEHITTKDAADYVASADRFTAATITAHHLLYNRNAIFIGGVRPHYYCLPVLKRETHRVALVQAATSGSSKFFLGTDSAPHPAHLKEHASGCAGCYTAHAAIEMYAEAFDNAGALDKLEGFASFHGPDFYRLPRSSCSTILQCTGRCRPQRRQRCRWVLCPSPSCPKARPTSSTSGTPTGCPRATTCTTSSTGWSGCSFRRPSGA